MSCHLNKTGSIESVVKWRSLRFLIRRKAHLVVSLFIMKVKVIQIIGISRLSD